jgi:hypothetical protein
LKIYEIKSIYASYSNEVWNTKDSIGKNTEYVKKQSSLDPGTKDVPNSAQRMRYWYAKRLVQIGRILKEDIEDVKIVVEGQAAYPEMNEWSAEYLEKNNLMDLVHSFSVSPYWGSSDYVTVMPEGPLDVEYFFRQGYRFADPIRTGDKIIGWANFRTEPGIYVMDRAAGFLNSPKGDRFFELNHKYQKVPTAYEGQGPAISSDLFKGTLAFGNGLASALNSDARLVSAIELHNKIWFERGGDLYNNFVFCSRWHNSTYAATDRIEVFGLKAQALALISSGHPLVEIDPEVLALRKENTALKELNRELSVTVWDAEQKVVKVKDLAQKILDS